MNASLRARKLEEKEFKWASTKENALAFIRGTEVFEDLKAEARTVKVEDLDDENDDGYENQANHQVRENARALVEDSIAKIIKHASSSKLSVVAEVIEALKTLKSSRLHLKRVKPRRARVRRRVETFTRRWKKREEIVAHIHGLKTCQRFVETHRRVHRRICQRFNFELRPRATAGAAESSPGI